MCLHPVRVGRDTYPCGKCLECIKSKQLDYAELMFTQAAKKHTCHFVTFTYDNDRLPIRCLDRQTGDIFYIDDCCDINNYLRNFYFRSKKLDKPFAHEDHGYRWQMCQSLRRRDLRLWLKRERMRMQRLGTPLPDFTYFAVGEYGEKSYRAHYHAMFFGLTTEQLNSICASWKKDFGYCLIKELPVLSSPDLARCSMYVAKYMNKGCADCPELLKDGSLMEKPRIMSSSGLSEREGLRSLFTLDGKLSIFATTFDKSDLNRVIERMNFDFGGKKFIIGKHFYKYALGIPNETFHQIANDANKFSSIDFQTTFEVYYESERKIYVHEVQREISTSRFKASPLQVALSYMLRSRVRKEDSILQAENLRNFFAADLVEVFGNFENYKSCLLANEEKTLQIKRQKDVSRSVF